MFQMTFSHVTLIVFHTWNLFFSSGLLSWRFMCVSLCPQGRLLHWPRTLLSVRLYLRPHPDDMWGHVRLRPHATGCSAICYWGSCDREYSSKNQGANEGGLSGKGGRSDVMRWPHGLPSFSHLLPHVVRSGVGLLPAAPGQLLTHHHDD